MALLDIRARGVAFWVEIMQKTLSSFPESPWSLHQRVFPLILPVASFLFILLFVMTINKAQRQAIKNIGIDPRTAVFSHGQLYIALSHCTPSHRIKVLFSEDSDTTCTTNIVYTEVLAGIINP